MANRILISICLCTTAFAPLLPAGIDGLPPDDTRLTLSVAQPVMLPYQATHVRVSLKNAGKQKVGPTFLSRVQNIEVKMSKAPGEGPRSTSLVVPPTVSPRLNRNPQSFRYDGLVDWYLAPGDAMTWSAAISQSYAIEALCTDCREKPDPLFGEPGEYTLTVHTAGYPDPADRRNSVSIRAQAQLTVNTPKGDDAKALKMIQGYNPLAYAILTPSIWPSPKALSPLRSLIRDCPKSSYAPYAHLALARSYLVDQEGEWVDAKDEDCKLALTHLEAALEFGSDFAFRPSALVMLMHAEPKQAKQVMAELARDYTFSHEWADAAASLPDITLERWRDEIRRLPASVIPQRKPAKP